MTSGKCKSCKSVLNTELRRQRLMELKVKDLRLYLINRNHQTEDCKEKHELVYLIQRHHGIFEPDFENHTRSYNTSNTRQYDIPTSNQAFNETSQASTPPATSVFSSFPTPPGYGMTQNAFESASQYMSTTPTTSSNQGGGVPVSSNANTTSSQPTKKEFPDIVDIQSAEELSTLSVKQLKFILRNNFVNYQGILEKKELINRVETLYFQNKKDMDSIKVEVEETGTSETIGMPKDENLCKICWDQPVNCVFLECSHMVTCIDCGKLIHECPVCRQNIVRKVRVFKS